ncbi:MAG: CBS domain-containing protein [Anaerolineae bacterium]|nr:CBS domain-containing protein [Anaerolineae bacterium]
MINYQVLEWMTPNPITVSSKATLPEAQQLMKDRKVRRLPVVDDGKLVGIVTQNDLFHAGPSQATTLSVHELNYLLDKVTIDQIMSRKVYTVLPSSTIRDAASLMLQHRISGLPVLSAGRLVGIITESDIFRLLIRELVNENTPPAIRGGIVFS